MTRFGVLKCAIARAQWSITALSVMVRPSFITMMAVTASIQRGSGRPMTATSETSGS